MVIICNDSALILLHFIYFVFVWFCRFAIENLVQQKRKWFFLLLALNQNSVVIIKKLNKKKKWISFAYHLKWYVCCNLFWEWIPFGVSIQRNFFHLFCFFSSIWYLRAQSWKRNIRFWFCKWICLHVYVYIMAASSCSSIHKFEEIQKWMNKKNKEKKNYTWLESHKIVINWRY